MLTAEQLKDKIELDIKKYKTWKIVKVILLIVIVALFLINIFDCLGFFIGYYNCALGPFWFLSVVRIIEHIRGVFCLSGYIGFDILLAINLASLLYIPSFFIIKSKTGLPVKVNKKPTVEELRYIFLKYEQNEIDRQQKYIEEYEREINSLR